MGNCHECSVPIGAKSMMLICPICGLGYIICSACRQKYLKRGNFTCADSACAHVTKLSVCGDGDKLVIDEDYYLPKGGCVWAVNSVGRI